MTKVQLHEPPLSISMSLTDEDINSIKMITSLPELVNKFLTVQNINVPELKDIPELDLKKVHIEDGQNLLNESETMNFTVKAESEATLTLGNTDHDLLFNLSLNTKNTSNPLDKVWEGLLSGSISFGTAQLFIEYSLTNPNRLTGSWSEITGEAMNFNDIPKALGIHHNLPIEALELDLQFSSIAFELRLDEGLFLFSARSTTLGEAFFVATNANSEWNFVFGIEIPLDQINGELQNMVGGLLSSIGIQNACCFFSTLKDDLFKIPELPTLPNSTQPAISFMKSWNFNVERGILFFAETSLSAASNPVLKLVPLLTDQDRILLQTPLSPPLIGQRFTSIFREPLAITITNDLKMTLKQPQLNFKINPPQVQLEGLMDISLGVTSLMCTGTIELSETHAQCSFRPVQQDENGQAPPFPAPLGLQGIQLDEIQVEMGMVYTPPSMSLGVNGTFHILDQPPRVNEFAIVFALQGVVIPQLFYSYMEQLDIATAYEAVTGKSLPPLPEFLTKVSAKQAFIFWSQIEKELPNGVMISPGAGFSGFIDLFGFKSHASLLVSEIGIQGSAQAAPFKLGEFLTIGGKGTGIELTEYLIDNQWIALKKEPDPNHAFQTRPKSYIEPGGAVFNFNTGASPYLYASAHVSFFELLNHQIEIEITDQGFRFELDYAIGNLASTTWYCGLHETSFTAKAEFTLDLDIEVGPITILDRDLGTYGLDIGFRANATITGSPNEWILEVSGDFMFEGAKQSLPSFRLSADLDMFRNLPGHLAEQVSSFLKSTLEFPSANELLQKALDTVNQTVEKAIENGQKLIENAEAEAEKIIQDAEHVVSSIGTSLEDAEKKAAALITEIDTIWANGTNRVNEIAAEAEAKRNELLGLVEGFPAKTVEEISKILNNATAEATRLADEGAAVLAGAAAQVQQNLKQANDLAVKLSDDAKKLIDEMNTEVDKVVKKFKEETNKILEAIEAYLKEQAKKLKNVGSDPGEPIRDFIKKRF